ncbi:hypothetical protein GCM10007170_15650 [Arthrobacter liuii]|uniref:Lipoprotein n=1 Tax=Arthrobacter liuii TaxID=1476996 RepID=A0ABQ2AR63_9MICC|nr:hypothetical protein GCM10007170_15650 [Arthrobacter liuii]
MSKRRKTVGIITIGIAATLGLSACNSAETKPNGTLGGAYSNAGGWVQLPDGHKVMCVAFGNGGVTCDWAGQK